MIQFFLPPNALTLYANLQVLLTCPTAQASYHAVEFFACEPLQDESAWIGSNYTLGHTCTTAQNVLPWFAVPKLNVRNNFAGICYTGYFFSVVMYPYVIFSTERKLS